MTVAEYAEKVIGVKLSHYQKEFIKKMESGKTPLPPKSIPKNFTHGGLKTTSTFIDEISGKKVNKHE